MYHILFSCSVQEQRPNSPKQFLD